MVLIGNFLLRRTLRSLTAVGATFCQSCMAAALSVKAGLFFGSIGLLTFSPTSGWARDIFVPGPAELRSALLDARAGDTLTLKNGRWPDTLLNVTQSGAPGQPVEIRAESPGEVMLTGSSTLIIKAPYIIVTGLCFTSGSIARNAVIQFHSHHGTVRETAIIDYNPPAFETEYYWVFFGGDHNRIDRCYFKGKSNLQPLIGNAIDGSRHNAVTNSYFKNIPYVPDANGREIIRVWGSGKTEQRDDDGAYFLIEGNLFDHADGEGTEIVSLKSNHNTLRANTVIATRGGLNIRRGNFNTVTDNIILGQGRAGAQGLRMSGEHNRVQGNFVSGCEYGIRVACGEYIAAALTPSYQPDIKPNAKRSAQVRIPTYPQNRQLTLADNVIVGTTGLDLEIGSSYKNHWPESQQVLLPENSLIQNNRFIRLHDGPAVSITVADSAPPLDRFHFQPNRYEGNIVSAKKPLSDPVVAGFSQKAIPADWSEETERTGYQPLTPTDVGPAWVIAARRAGKFNGEDDTPQPKAAAHPKTSKRKK